MDNAFVVGRSQCLADLFADLYSPFNRKNLLILNHFRQIASLDEGHRDELHSSAFAKIVDTQHVLMRDATGQQKLLLESLQDLRVRHQVSTDDFEGDHAIKLQVIGLVDAAHAPFAQFAFETIAWTEIRTRRRSRSGKRST